MSSKDPVGALLSDTELRNVFKTVYRARKIRRDKLFQSLGAQTEEDRKVVLENIGFLEGVDLIEESPASLSDWTVYHITASGLSAMRAIDRLDRFEAS